MAGPASPCPLSCGTPKSPGRELKRTSQLLSAEHLRAGCGNKCASVKHSLSDEKRLRKLRKWGVLHASISTNMLKAHSFRIMSLKYGPEIVLQVFLSGQVSSQRFGGE